MSKAATSILTMEAKMASNNQIQAHLSNLKQQEADLLRDMSAIYEKLNEVRERKERKGDHELKIETTPSTSSHTEHTQEQRRRIILVTRTLPYQLTREETNTSYPNQQSTKWRAEYPEHETFDGAMAAYLALHSKYDCIWVGAAHGKDEVDIDDASDQNAIKEQLLSEHRCYPVFLGQKREQLFYQGYCKSVLWPLFHSIPPTADDQLETGGQGLEDYAAADAYFPTSTTSTAGDVKVYDGQNYSFATDRLDKMWNAYASANQLYADAVQEVYEEGDLIWIQDYHLFLVPQMVQNLFPSDVLTIGFFLQVPFPSSELYRILSNREDILMGMLGATLIGFQTYGDARHFQSSAVRVLGLESSHKGVECNGHFSKITICPVGIDAEKVETMVKSSAVQDIVQQLQAQFKGKTLLLGIDPLDITKGLVPKLLAIEELFTKDPELAKEVVFVQMIIGSTNTNHLPERLERLGSQVQSIVSRINARLQDLGTEAPVQYFHNDVQTMEKVLALYALADALVVTSLRDGMNTTPFDYIVTREAVNQPAKLILSQFAGCAQSLGGGAMLVNPWDTNNLHDALLQVLQHRHESTPQPDTVVNHAQMYDYVSSFSVHHWATNFIDQMTECAEELGNGLSISQRELSRHELVSSYVRSNRRLIFINYEGVLAGDASIPELSFPPQELLWQLMLLLDDKRNTVVLVSSRSTHVCDQWFSQLLQTDRVVLAAEYGVYIKWKGEDNSPRMNDNSWRCTIPNLDVEWRDHVLPLLEYYTERTPGAYIEHKASAVTWHYRDCELHHGLWQASELLIGLRELIRSLPVSVYSGKRYLEVRPKKVSKAALFERIWEYLNYNSLFPNGEFSIAGGNVSVEYFGEQIQSPTGSNRQEVPGTMDIKRVNIPEKATERSTPVDFVLVIASGNDRTDEDLFAVLVPPPIDLVAYCRQLEKEQVSKLQDESIKGNKPLEIQVKDTAKAPGSELKRGVSGASQSGKTTDPASAGSLSPRGVSDSATTMFPRRLLSATSTRQGEITSKSKFTPRRDFPPSAALYNAMKVKYGENFGMDKVPATPAAAWALVCPPPARARLEDNGETRGSSSSSDPLERQVSFGDITERISGPSPHDALELMEEIENYYGGMKYRFPVNTFVCTLGRKLSQAPYYVKHAADLYQLLQEMGLSSQRQKHRYLSMGALKSDNKH